MNLVSYARIAQLVRLLVGNSREKIWEALKMKQSLFVY